MSQPNPFPVKFARHLQRCAEEQERQIVVALVEDALAAGCTVGVYDGEDHVLTGSRDEEAIFAALGGTDRDILILHSEADGSHVGNVLLVWGNGWAVLSDWHTDLEGRGIIERAEKLAESLNV